MACVVMAGFDQQHTVDTAIPASSAGASSALASKEQLRLATSLYHAIACGHERLAFNVVLS